MKHRITTQKELRREFWATFPELNRQRIPDYSGDGKTYRVDTRCTFCDWVDALSRGGDISEALASRATLD